MKIDEAYLVLVRNDVEVESGNITSQNIYKL